MADESWTNGSPQLACPDRLPETVRRARFFSACMFTVHCTRTPGHS
jgi:hypothetical protein